MTEYPILVARYGPKHPSDVAVCERCDQTVTIDPAEGDPYDLCTKHDGCGGQVVMKYLEGDTCRGCGKLDYGFSATLKGCCSRRCMLQWEYAQQLKAAS